MKLVIDADVKQPFDPSECKWTEDSCALHEPTGCVFDMDTGGNLYLVRLKGSMPTLRDVILAAKAAQTFMEEVPLLAPDKPGKKTRSLVFDWVM